MTIPTLRKRNKPVIQTLFDQKEEEKPQEDFKHLRPGTPEWMLFWKEHPSQQNEMVAFMKLQKPKPTLKRKEN